MPRKRDKVESPAVPRITTLEPQAAAQVAAAWGIIDAACVFVRDIGDDDSHIVVHAPGLGSWKHATDTTAERISARFPAIPPRDLRALVAAISGRAALSVNGGRTQTRQRASWVHGWREERAENHFNF